MVNSIIENINLWSISESTTAIGINIQYAKNPFINNVFIKSFTYGLYLGDSYKPMAKISTFQVEKTGFGYGVTTSRSTMYADIQIHAVSARHCFTTSGGDGISWGTIVHDSIGIAGVNIDTGHFDTHASSGLVTFDNCIAYAGLKKDYINTIIDWNDTSTFSVNDLVRSTNKYLLYKAYIENTDVDPDTDTTGSWYEQPGNSTTAFKAEGLNQYYNNCKAFGCAQGFYIYGTAMKNTVIKNCETHDCTNGVYSLNNANVDNLIIDGLHMINENPRFYGIILSAGFDYGVFNNIHAKNCLLFQLSSGTYKPKEISINNFSCEQSFNNLDLAAINIGYYETTNITISNGIVRNRALINTVNTSNIYSDDILHINNVKVYSPYADTIKIQGAMNNIIINGLIVSDPSTEGYFISTWKNVGNIVISNSAYIGLNAINLIYSDGEMTLDNILHNGNIFPNLTTFRTGTGALAANVITSGSIGI